MKVIYKYEITVDDNPHYIHFPDQYKIVLVGRQKPNTITVWVEHEYLEDFAGNRHEYRVVPAGARIPNNYIHIGSVCMALI
jgi:hypothetical protein